MRPALLSRLCACVYICVSVCECEHVRLAIPRLCGSTNSLISAARLGVYVCARARVRACVSEKHLGNDEEV